MTTFQTIIYAIVQGFSVFLPVSWDAHQSLVPYFTRWQEPTGAISGALGIGALLAFLVYFRHDIASVISCFLQVLIFRKRPMTFDERFPIFLMIATIPAGLAAYYCQDKGWSVPVANAWALDWPIQWNVLTISASLAFWGVVFWIADSMGRKSKSMFDWNWIDASWVGLFQLATLTIGLGVVTATLIVAMFRNYSREAATKFALFSLAPFITVQAIRGLHETNFHAPMPDSDLSWLSFGVGVVVSLFTGLLVIGGLMKQVQKKGFGQYIIYRWLVAAAAVGVYWYRARSGG
jgi:undecaprenyl-diphosphatase